jgi:phenylpropionate dioxygenase-like ring-hydroxylating dioxygenase large terminal subunit
MTSKAATGGPTAPCADSLMTTTTAQPPSHPAGWYVVAFSSELAPGTVLTRTFFGGEVVVYRTHGGTAVVAHAFCPHLGAHLGRAGRVDGETLRCGFHGFRFDTQGACVGAYPERKTPGRCSLPVYESRERNGHVIAYSHPERLPPTWEVPALDDSEFRPQRTRTWNLRGHPQEVSENSVDVGHFAVLHGYTRVDAIEPVTANGPLLHGQYTMHRVRSGLSRPVTTDFEIWVWGLGYSVVEAHIRDYDVCARTFVLPTPAQAGHIDLRIALQLRRLQSTRAVHRLAAPVPRALLEAALERVAMLAYAHDVEQDLDIWQHKTYLEKPALAAGDGPVGMYRRWASQFYPGRATEPSPR